MFPVEPTLQTPASDSSKGIKVCSTLCSRCGAAEPRPNGRYCLACHAAYNRSNRLKHREARERQATAWRNLTISNAETKQKFDTTIGTTHVIIVQPGGDRIDFAGTVTGYHAAEKLSVINEHGNLVTVDLAMVRPDKYKLI